MTNTDKRKSKPVPPFWLTEEFGRDPARLPVHWVLIDDDYRASTDALATEVRADWQLEEAYRTYLLSKEDGADRTEAAIAEDYYITALFHRLAARVYVAASQLVQVDICHMETDPAIVFDLLSLIVRDVKSTYAIAREMIEH